MLNVNEIKKRFPGIIKNSDVIFFDNASTSQKPDTVLEVINDYYLNYCANSGRSEYRWANKIALEIEEVRQKVARFINAPKADEVVFTAGATDSLNTVVYSWALHNLKEGDEIMVCATDHKSAVLPWINLKNILREFEREVKIVYFEADSNAGDYLVNDLVEKVGVRTKIIALTDIHNVYGVDVGIQNIRNKIGYEVLISVDASQSVGHKYIDVRELGADFLSFSGHKMFADTGVGILWINERVHSQLKPFRIGGGYPGAVDWDEKEFEISKMPGLLEGGTQNISAILSLGKAIDFIEEIGLNSIQNHIFQLTAYMLNRLQETDLEIEFLPGPIFCKRCASGYGIVGFNIKGINPNDVGFVLSENNILVRTGSHCTAKENSQEDSVRVSMHVYNSIEEIDKFIEVLTENF